MRYLNIPVTATNTIDGSRLLFLHGATVTSASIYSLTLLLWVPGVIHAIYIVVTRDSPQAHYGAPPPLLFHLQEEHGMTMPPAKNTKPLFIQASICMYTPVESYCSACSQLAFTCLYLL